MKKNTIASLYRLGVIKGLAPDVRQSSGGRLYFTATSTGKNKEGKDVTTANNLYFGQGSEKALRKEHGEVIVGALLTTEQLRKIEIIDCITETGEERFKASLPGNSRFMGTSELDEIFGEQEQEFDLARFINEFTYDGQEVAPIKTIVTKKANIKMAETIEEA